MSTESDVQRQKREFNINHFGHVLAKKLKGESDEERAYNADMEDLKRLTGRDLLYVGPNARANMKADLKAARLKHINAAHPVLLEDEDRKKWLTQRLLEDRDCKRLHQHAQEWMDLMELHKLHMECTSGPTTTCRGCFKQVCCHLADYVCISVPVCQWCDTRGQPNPFNPINRESLLPKGSAIVTQLCAQVDKVGLVVTDQNSIKNCPV